LRELGVRAQPRALLAGVTGLQLKELANPEVRCGFGGTFCVKYPDISARIAEKKLADIQAVGPCDAVVSTDLGCLMHLGGSLHREGSEMRVLHIAEVLAGMTDNEDIS
jgi:L-lactate dehydrogenase complex protein LldE